MVQATVKKRGIDHAKATLHILATGYSECFAMNAAVARAQVLKVVLAEAEKLAACAK